MRNEHKTNVLIIEDGRETARSCEKAVKTREHLLELYTGDHNVETIEGPAEVLLIADTGKCWHKWTLDG